MTKSSKLASEILSATGIACLSLSTLAGHPGHCKISIGGIGDLKATGERVWFRSERDARRVLDACLSRCFAATRTATGLTIKLPYEQVVGLVDLVGFTLGIMRISDRTVAMTFDSISSRAEAAIKGAARAGTMKRIKAALAQRERDELYAAN